MPLYMLVDKVYESLRRGFTTRTLFHMHSFPRFISPSMFPMLHCVPCYVSCYLITDPVWICFSAMQLKILFNSGTCKVSSPHLVRSDCLTRARAPPRTPAACPTPTRATSPRPPRRAAAPERLRKSVLLIPLGFFHAFSSYCHRGNRRRRAPGAQRRQNHVRHDGCVHGCHGGLAA